MVIISKKDTIDLSRSIAETIKRFAIHHDIKMEISEISIASLIEEGLNDWIDEIENEADQDRRDRKTMII